MLDLFLNDMVLLVALGLNGAALSVVLGAVLTRETTALCSFVATQRRRYATLMCGQAMFAANYVFLLYNGSSSDVVTIAGQYRDANPVLGWIISISLLVGLSSPIWSLLSWTVIYRWPAQMAYKVRGAEKYITTNDYRDGNTDAFVQPHYTTTRSGAPVRKFVDV